MAVNVPRMTLIPDGAERVSAFVLLSDSADLLRWFPQAIPGDDVGAALVAYQNGGFFMGEDAAYDLLMGFGPWRKWTLAIYYCQKTMTALKKSDSPGMRLLSISLPYLLKRFHTARHYATLALMSSYPVYRLQKCPSR